MRARFSTLVLMCLSLASIARANDSMTGGLPSDLIPLETKQVRMVAEDILIEADGEDWVVTADYTFENLTARDVNATVGFPEAACEDAGKPHVPDPDSPCDPQRMRFRQMRTTVDGAAVVHRQGAVTSQHPWAPHLGAVWLYDVRFPAKQQVRVNHRYRVGQGVNSGGMVFGSYVTRTGALWAGSIGHARFRIHVPVEAHIAEAGVEGTGLSLTKQRVEVDGKRIGELLLEAREWNPTRDIGFNFNARYGATGEELMGFYERQEMYRTSGNALCSDAAVGAILGIIGEQAESSTPVTPSHEVIERLVIQGFGTPAMCRDFIYALHGRRFDSYWSNVYFYGLGGWMPGSWPFAYLVPNPEYSDAMITERDQAGFRLIDAMEKRLAPCEACKPCETAKAVEAPSSAGCGVTRGRDPRAGWGLALAVATAIAMRRRTRSATF